MSIFKFSLIITIFFSSFSLAYSKSNLKEKLIEIKKLSKRSSVSHYFDFDIEGEKLKLKQKVKIEDCRLELNTLHPEYGHLFRDQFDLTRSRPLKRLIKYKGAYSITFGIKRHIKGRTAVYFNSKDDRQKSYISFSKLGKLCRDKKVTKYFEKNGHHKNKKPVSYVGKLPQGKSFVDGRVLKVGNHTMSVLDGPRSFIERYNAIKNAKHSIYVQSLIYRGDEAGKFLSDMLIKKKGEGLDVRMIVDALGTGPADKPQTKTDRKNTSIMLNNLQAAGIRVYGYSCKFNIINEFQGIDIGKILRRNHEKLWIVDADGNKPRPSSMVIMGGVNVAQEYFALTGSSKRSWRDQDVGIKGPIVNSIAKDFLTNFIHKKIRFRTYSTDSHCLNPYDPIKEKEKYLTFKNEKTKQYVPFKRISERADAKLMNKNIEKLLNGAKELDDEIKVRPIKYYPVKEIRFVLARPEEEENYAYHAYVDLIKKAKRTIDVHHALLIPPPEFKEALIKAAKRGVKIRFLSRSPETNQFAPITIVGRRHYYDLYNFLGDEKKCNEEGLTCPEFWEWNGRKENDGPIIMETTHAKFMVIDESIGVIGSHNMDYSSMNNAETVVLFNSPGVGNELTKLFDEDLRLARKIGPEQLKDFASPKNKKDYILLKTFMLIEKLL